MADVYERIKELNIQLPSPPAAGGIYTPVLDFSETLLYCSGCGPGDASLLGKVGQDITLEEAQKAAQKCILNLLANLEAKIKDLNKIKRFVKILAFVASDDTFTQQPQVVNGGSQLLVDIFGDTIGKPTRSAIGVNVLPGNIPVEIELLVELKKGTEKETIG